MVLSRVAGSTDEIEDEETTPAEELDAADKELSDVFEEVGDELDAVDKELFEAFEEADEEIADACDSLVAEEEELLFGGVRGDSLSPHAVSDKSKNANRHSETFIICTSKLVDDTLWPEVN